MQQRAFQHRGLRGLAAALLALAAPLALTACTPTTYARISLKPGATDPEIQALARRAQAGDKDAQLALGIRYEEGRGVPRDLARAEELFRSASTDTGGSRLAYSRSVPGANSPGVAAVSQGPLLRGLPSARARWLRLRSREPRIETPDETSSAVSLETYLSDRLIESIERGGASEGAMLVRRISGPSRFTARLNKEAPPEVGGEICNAIKDLVERFRDFGFHDCVARKYIRRPLSHHGSSETYYAIRYSDDYELTEEFQSDSGHVPYRPPFVAIPGLVSEEVLCGEHSMFEIFLRSGRSYRILISTELLPQQRTANPDENCR